MCVWRAVWKGKEDVDETAARHKNDKAARDAFMDIRQKFIDKKLKNRGTPVPWAPGLRAGAQGLGPGGPGGIGAWATRARAPEGHGAGEEGEWASGRSGPTSEPAGGPGAAGTGDPPGREAQRPGPGHLAAPGPRIPGSGTHGRLGVGWG